MLSTKNYNNNSSLYANTARFNKLECDEAEISNYPSISFLNSSIQDIYSVIASNYYNRTESDTNYPTFGYFNDTLLSTLDNYTTVEYVNNLNQIFYAVLGTEYYDQTTTDEFFIINQKLIQN